MIEVPHSIRDSENERADKPIVKWTQGGELIEEGLLVLFKSDTSYHFGFAVEGKSGDKPPKQVQALFIPATSCALIFVSCSQTVITALSSKI